MKLIIAEKPSQAKDYADALGGFQRKDGYLQSNEYYITWCFGHLIELERDTAYRESTKWSKDYLPLLPQNYKYTIGKDAKGKPDEGKEKQLKIIKDLAQKSTEIINATDADREGELIFRYVYNYLGLQLPFKRLWISSLTKGDIQKGFNHLLSATDVESLSKAGYARAISDWLIGVNGTQAATLQLGGGNLLSVGRVQTAILKIICERYLKNKNFKTSFTYRLRALHSVNHQEFNSVTDVFETEAEAQMYLQKISKEKHLFKGAETTQKKQVPPLLFSIDTLIVSCNKLFNLSGQETLNIAQSLYEKKLTTYPRTDSNYINEENFENLKRFLPDLAQEYLSVNYSFSTEKPKSVNAEKLTGSHDAIVPTGQTDAVQGLNQKEMQVYQLIIQRCLESFSTPAVYEKTNYLFENEGVRFATKTSILLDAGWKRFSQNAEKEENEEGEQSVKLNLQPNEYVPVTEFETVKIEAKPPQLYTDANLTPALTKIDKFLKEENPQLYEDLRQKIDLKDVQIGTQATRPAIIERLKKLDFIKVEKKKYLPTEKGLQYYNIIKDLQLANIANTAILEKQLKDIQEGRLLEKDFYTELNQYVTDIVKDIFSIEKGLEKEAKAGLGVCPKCQKGQIFEGKKGYGCSEWKQGCDFVIWKTIAEKSLTEKQVKDLLEKGQTAKIKGFKSKAGKSFEAQLSLNPETFKVEFKF